MPKSVSSTRPSGVTRMLPGLTSRWTKPARWAASSAAATHVPMWIVSSGLSRVCTSSSWRRLLPSTSCITTAWRPLVLEDVVDGDDVRVGQPGDGDRLAAEALGDDGVGGEARLEPLEGDLAVEREVGGQPHLGHPALREASLEPVAPGEHDRSVAAAVGQTRLAVGGRGRRRHSATSTLVATTCSNSGRVETS